MWGAIGSWLLPQLMGGATSSSTSPGFWEGILGGIEDEIPEILGGDSTTAYVKGGGPGATTGGWGRQIGKKLDEPNTMTPLPALNAPQAPTIPGTMWSPAMGPTPATNNQVNFIRQKAMEELLFGPKGNYWK